MAFAVTWAGGPAKAPAPRDTPPITLSDLDGDGDLDMLVETQTPFGRADDVFNNDGEQMTRLVVGLAKRELDSRLGDLLPGYARWLAGADSVGLAPSDDLVGVAPLPQGPEAAMPERFDTGPSTLGDDYPQIRTLTMNFTGLARRLATANPEPDETIRRHRLLSIQKMGAPGGAAKPRSSGLRLLGGPSVRDDFLAVIDNHTAIPADTHGAVGPEHLVVALNTEIAIQTREGELLSKVGLGDFWAGFSHGFVFDPKVVYDHLVKRWVVFTIADVNTTKSAVLIALSQTSDPTGDWDMASIRVHPEAAPDNYLYADYPSVGYNKKWLAASVNLYKGTNEVSGTKEFVGSRIFAFHKPDYIRKSKVYYTQFDDPGYFTVVPATTFDADDTNLLFVTEQSTYALRISALSGKVGQEHYTPHYARTSVKGIEAWKFSIGKTNISPQKAASKKIFANDSRMHALAKRNGKLWAAHHVFLPEGMENVDRTAIQWWNLETNATIIQHGYICLLYTSPSPRDRSLSRMPSSA